MTYTCTTCGRTNSEAITDARSLGLQQELQSGIYTCCQITAWADEQALAWFEALHADAKPIEHTELLEWQSEAVLVRVRCLEVSWFENPDDLN